MIERNKKGQFVKGGKSWKGGRNYDGQGYVRIWKPGHPFANHGYVLEHRLVMEKKLGCYLDPKEIVHHINHIKDDNRPENLMLLDITKHKKFHPTVFTKETKEKIRKTLMGHKVLRKTRKKIGIANLKRYKRDEKFGFQKGNKFGINKKL